MRLDSRTGIASSPVSSLNRQVITLNNNSTRVVTNVSCVDNKQLQTCACCRGHHITKSVMTYLGQQVI